MDLFFLWVFHPEPAAAQGQRQPLGLSDHVVRQAGAIPLPSHGTAMEGGIGLVGAPLAVGDGVIVGLLTPSQGEKAATCRRG